MIFVLIIVAQFLFWKLFDFFGNIFDFQYHLDYLLQLFVSYCKIVLLQLKHGKIRRYISLFRFNLKKVHI